MSEIIKALIEEGGHRWAASSFDRQYLPVLIALSNRPETIFELRLEPGAQHPFWTVRERPIDPDELADLLSFRRRHLSIGVIAPLSEDRYYRVRAYVCNTRSLEWTLSVEFGRVEFTPDKK